MKKGILLAIVLFITVAATAQTRKYQPQSDWEKAYYDICQKEIYPDEVRSNLEEYEDTVLAWTGIIQKYMIDESAEEYNVVFYFVEQRYFDWIEDFYYEKPLNLTSYGEGFFTTYFLLKKDAPLEDYGEKMVGNMVIAYGYPYAVDPEDGTVQMSGEYIRFISSEYVDVGRGNLFWELQ